MAKEKERVVVVNNSNILIYVLIFLLGAIIATVILAISSGVCDADITGKVSTSIEPDETAVQMSVVGSEVFDENYVDTVAIADDVLRMYLARDAAMFQLDTGVMSLDEIERQIQMTWEEIGSRFNSYPMAHQLYISFTEEMVSEVLNRIVQLRLWRGESSTNLESPVVACASQMSLDEASRIPSEVVPYVMTMNPVTGARYDGVMAIEYLTCTGQFAVTLPQVTVQELPVVSYDELGNPVYTQ
jgi:hypothetical protein